MKLFSKLPLTEYRFSQDNWLQVRNVFIKLGLLESLRDNPAFLTTVTLNSAERADVLAHRLYGDSNLFWTLYLVNDIVDPSDWIMDDYTLSRYVKAKYDNPMGTHSVTNDAGTSRIINKGSPFGTVNMKHDTTRNSSLSNQQYEEEVNERRRTVRAIRKEYISAFLIDVERKLG